jgi:hypothetical protein
MGYTDLMIDALKSDVPLEEGVHFGKDVLKNMGVI